jgi:mRNA interferase HigB
MLWAEWTQSMRVISKNALEEFWTRYPRTKKELEIWHNMTVGAAWEMPTDVKAAFGQRVDFVLTHNKNTVTVFDVSNNRCRLIAAIHYVKRFPVKGRVYILRVLTHDEYDLARWKDEL